MSNTTWDYENALLIYHAGVGMEMNYGPNGSSSTPYRAVESMEDFWGFNSNIDLRWRIWHLLTWKDDLKGDLDLGRPLLYSGGSLGDGGHSWVIEGYTSSDEFWCNWGWEGDYNATYSLGGFNPGGYDFNELESAIFYAYPNKEAGPIDGADFICYGSNESYILKCCPTGASVSWSKSSNISWVGTPSGVNCTATSSGSSVSGIGWIKATITKTDNSVVYATKDVWVGVPYVNPATIQFESSEGSGYFCSNSFGNEFSFTFDHQFNYFDIKLTNLSETQTFTQFRIYGTWGTMDYSPPDGTYLFQVRGNNECGTATNWTKKAVDFVDCGMGGLFSLDIYPNPAIEQATITIVSNEDMNAVTKTVDEEWQIEVYTQGQLLKHSVPAINDNKYILNTSGWKPGMYFIRVYYKEEVVFGTLVISK